MQRCDEQGGGRGIAAVLAFEHERLQQPFLGAQRLALGIDEAPGQAWRPGAQAQARHQVGGAQQFHQRQGVAHGAFRQ